MWLWLWLWHTDWLTVSHKVASISSGGGFQYPHHVPASSRRQRKWNPVSGGISGIDTGIWPLQIGWVSNLRIKYGHESRGTRTQKWLRCETSSNCKQETSLLVREGTPLYKHANIWLTWSWTPMRSWHQDRLAYRPSVIIRPWISFVFRLTQLRFAAARSEKLLVQFRDSLGTERKENVRCSKSLPSNGLRRLRRLCARCRFGELQSV
jgi:hypothetical protein